MSYVGNGTSDISCFSVLNDGGGIAIGVDKEAQTWEEQIQVSQSQRVTNLATADYCPDSELMRSLTLVLESLCKQISLR